MTIPDTACLPMSTPVASPSVPNLPIPSRPKPSLAASLSKVQPPSTLSDVLTALGKIHTIDQARTKQLAAAIRTCGRLLNRPLEGLPASPKLLLPMLLELTPQRSIRSAKTLANMRTLVKRALILTGAGRRVRHDGTPLSPAWQALYNQLPTKRLKHALSRLIHYANQASIRPDQVNQSFLDQFVADIAKSGEVKNVPLRHRDSAIFWNQSATAIKGWPQTFLHEPVIKRVMRNLTWDQLPENLRQEVDDYCAWLSGTDVFAEDGPARPCKSSTIRQRREILRIVASNLIASGVAPDAANTLDTLIDPDNAKIVLRRVYAQAGNKPTAFVRLRPSLSTSHLDIARMIKRVATNSRIYDVDSGHRLAV